jgi:formate C-acetyltransferase
MAGNDRSGTVDCNLNLLKAVELALTGGKDLLPFVNPMTFKKEKIRRHGPDTGDAAAFQNWEEFWTAYKRQARYIIQKCVDLYEQSESVRTRFLPTPYLSCLVKGCAEDARENPQDYRHLLVRITGYNAYFTSVGRELQNEVIARLSHEKF